MRASSRLLGFVLVGALATPASAHLGLRHPPSREGDSVLKVGPCGRAHSLRSTHVTVLEPGAALDVVWDEYVDHPGHFRISFDADGVDDFGDPPCMKECFYSNDAVLLDQILDTPRGGEGGARITLPDIECDNCTLQVIQVMYDKPPYTLPGDDIYYQCADLVLRRSAAATPTPSPSASPSPTPTATPSPVTCPLRLGVILALNDDAIASCRGVFDRNGDGAVTVEELVGSRAARAGRLQRVR